MQLGKVGRVKAYQQAVLAEWPKGGQLCQKIAAFSSKVNELGSRACGDDGVQAALVEEGDQLMAKALGSMLTGLGRRRCTASYPRWARGVLAARGSIKSAQHM